jgi:hypothetical protein
LIDAWLHLTDDNTVIYLEGAEDFDIVRKDRGAVAAQIRNTSQPILSWNTKSAAGTGGFLESRMRSARIAAWTWIISRPDQPRWRWIQTLAESPARGMAHRALSCWKIRGD